MTLAGPGQADRAELHITTNHCRHRVRDDDNSLPQSSLSTKDLLFPRSDTICRDVLQLSPAAAKPCPAEIKRGASILLASGSPHFQVTCSARLGAERHGTAGRTAARYAAL